jgi:hypothetical protein
MKTFRFFDSAVVALVSLGILMPAPQASAAQPVPSVTVVNRAAADVALTPQGQLLGRVVDHSGQPQAKQEVIVRQGNIEVARATTNERGVFQVSQLRGGVYEVASGATSGTYRMWTPQAAPPQAGEQALLVVGENGTRGQYGMIGSGKVILIAIATTGVVLGLVALKRISDLEDEVDQMDEDEGGVQTPESP